MLKEQREEQILMLLEQQGSVEVARLCEILGVTKMTVRRDLDKLEKEGKITRIHGGATLNNPDVLLEKPLALRLHTNAESKRGIAAVAISLLKDGDKVFFSSGTTVYNMARLLDNSKRLLVVTDGLNTAIELAKRTNISIIITGGEVKNNTLAMTGHFADEMIAQFQFETAFLGVTSIAADGTFYHGSLVEVGMFKALEAATKKRVLLADSHKLGKTDFLSVGKLRSGDILITDEGVDPEIAKNYEDMGVEVIQAPAS